MNVDVERIKARGPWVLVKPEPPAEKSRGGVYLPQGNLVERMGHVVGRVVSTGKGYYETNDKTKKAKLIETTVQPGERVVFRGHLKDANTLNRGEYCFMHAQDLVLVLSEDAELDLALPRDN